jgi:outer membrane biosynthesis protein TonB
MRPARRDSRLSIALLTSAAVHLAVVLLLIFGLPHGTQTQPAHATAVATPISFEHPLPKISKKQQAKPREQPKAQPQPPPPPPPPPMKEVELGPKSTKPDAPAKEAAAKKSDPEKSTPVAANTPAPVPAETPPPPAPPPPAPQPPAPQRIQLPRAGDYTALGAIPRPTTSPWGPPKLDSASGAPPPSTIRATTGSMGRSGITSPDPQKWENSFDEETSGQCPEIPDNGRNPDGTPVLSSVLGRVLDTDGRTPMAGAHLQIVGTPFSTFSDEQGEYRLSFDPHLLQKCRKQYVEVVAPGYRNQLLTLMIGPRVRSDDVVLHHH